MENEKIEQNENMITPSPEEVLVNMRENMVPKEEAVKWQQKYYDLFQNVANGSFSGEDKTPAKSEEDLKADYESNLRDIANTSKSMKPLDLFKKAIEIDSYRTSHGERSAFAPSEGEITPDIQRSCEKTHELLQSVIDQSDGSNEVALAYLGNHLSDSAGIASMGRRL